MSKMAVWVGIDVGETLSFAAAIDANDALVAEAMLATNVEAVVSFFDSLGDCTISQIAVEAGDTGTHLVRGLRELGLPVIIYEARRASHYLRVRLNKTDANDARGLAEIARLARSVLTRVHLKSPAFQKLRSDLMFRHKLTLHRVACEGMIRSRLRLNGGRLARVSSPSTLQQHVGTELERMKRELGIDLASDIQPLVDLAIGLRKFLLALDAQLTAFAKADPTCRRFMTVPGVGPICAISFYSAVEDPNRFACADDVGPYLGLTPLVSQSGNTKRHGRISRRGNTLTRSHLTMAAGALLLRCGENPLNIWGKALASRAGHGKARVALARKLAVLLLAMWKSGARYDPEWAGSRRKRGAEAPD